MTGQVHGEPPFVFFRMHWDHEPLAVPRQTESADKSDALQTLGATASASGFREAFGVRPACRRFFTARGYVHDHARVQKREQAQQAPRTPNASRGSEAIRWPGRFMERERDPR